MEGKKDQPSCYKKSGVDLDKVLALKDEIKKLAMTTYAPQVLTGVGPFGAMGELDYRDRRKVLVFTADGVGTKLKLAQMMGSLITCGQDLVNHCVNDILCQGAKPLFFLDYIAQDKLRPKEVLELIEGMVNGCRENGVSLIGGETSQMPGFYQKDHSDIAGFMVGLVEKYRIIDGHFIRPGDKILGLPSSDLHTNGYSLVNKLFWEEKKWSPYFYFKELAGQLGRILLEPHKSYLKPVQALLQHRKQLAFYYPSIKSSPLINGIAHITGGGLKENIERILPEKCQAKIRFGSWPIFPIFQFIQKEGQVSDEEMYRVFNMGIGMVLVVSRIDYREIFDFLWKIGQPVYEIGEIADGTRSVSFYGAES